METCVSAPNHLLKSQPTPPPSPNKARKNPKPIPKHHRPDLFTRVDPVQRKEPISRRVEFEKWFLLPRFHRYVYPRRVKVSFYGRNLNPFYYPLVPPPTSPAPLFALGHLVFLRCLAARGGGGGDGPEEDFRRVKKKGKRGAGVIIPRMIFWRKPAGEHLLRLGEEGSVFSFPSAAAAAPARLVPAFSSAGSDAFPGVSLASCSELRH